MLFFELKKIYKNKLFIILVLFSILISLYNLAINGPINISITNEVDSAYGSLLHDLNPDSEIIKDLSDEDKEKIVNEWINYNKDFRYPWEDKKNDEEYALNMTKAYIENYLYQDNLIKKYNIELDSKTQKVWAWGLFESKYMIDTKTPVSKFLMSNISINPLRTIIYNDNLIFGTSIIILIIFVFSGIISKEKESNTIFY